MKEIIATKKVCKTGTGQAIYLDSEWGYRIGDLVQVRISMVRRVDRPEDDARTKD